jgi:hypothetical protein
MRAMGGVLVLAVLVSGCGSPSDLDPRGPGSSEPAARPGDAAAPSAASLPPAAPVPAVSPPPARPARIGAKAEPSIEKCIENAVRSTDHDRMDPRDSRRRLRRLQVKADCEQQLASR